jgi:hypothetical protein
LTGGQAGLYAKILSPRRKLRNNSFAGVACQKLPIPPEETGLNPGTRAEWDKNAPMIRRQYLLANFLIF